MPKKAPPRRPRPEPPPPPPPPPPPTEEELADAARKKELRELDHEINRKKRECEVARWKTKTKHAEIGILEEKHADTPFTKKHAEVIDPHLTELDAAVKLGAEKVTRLRREANRIFLDVNMLKGEKRVRLRALLDVYQVDASALPPAIREILEEDDGYEYEES